MRRFLALALATAPLLLAAPAYAGDDNTTCRDTVKLQMTRISDLNAIITADQALEKQLLDRAVAHETAADAKDEQAKKFKAAADATTDPKKKKAYLDLAAQLEGEAKTDRLFAKEMKNAAGIASKQRAQAQSAVDFHTQILNRLKDRCPS